MLPPDALSPMELHSSPFSTQPAQTPTAPSPLEHSTHLNARPDSGMHRTATSTSHAVAAIIEALATTSNHSETVQDYLESLVDDTSHTDPTHMHSGNRATQQTERADTHHDPSRARSSSSHSSSSILSPTDGGAGILSHVDAGGKASMVDVGEVSSTGRGQHCSSGMHAGQTAGAGWVWCSRWCGKGVVWPAT
jgi:hypothetical protein